MCIFGKFTIFVAICILMASFVGISEGLKCYYGHGKTAGSVASIYEEKECEDNENACLSIDCAGVHDGSTLKVCQFLPADVDLNKQKCRIETSICNITGVHSGGKYCSFCRGDLCNSDHIFTTTTNMTMPNKTMSSTNNTLFNNATQNTTLISIITTIPHNNNNETNDPQENGFTFHYPAAISLLFAIGTVMTADGHFLVL